MLTNPTNGVFSSLTSRLAGSTATLQCDSGYIPSVSMVMCLLDTVMWNPDPEDIECRPLTQPPPTIGESMSAVHEDVDRW